MIRRPPRSTRTDTLFPYTTLFRSVWSEGGFSASAFANYTGGVREDFWSAGVGERTASFTTVDATLSYRIGERRDMWSGLEFSLSAQNLLDRDPSLFAFNSVYVPRSDATITSRSEERRVGKDCLCTFNT